MYFKNWTWNIKERSGEIASKLGHSALQNRAPKYLQSTAAFRSPTSPFVKSTFYSPPVDITWLCRTFGRRAFSIGARRSGTHCQLISATCCAVPMTSCECSLDISHFVN